MAIEPILAIYHGHANHDPMTGAVIKHFGIDVSMALLKDCALRVHEHMNSVADDDKVFGKRGLELPTTIGTMVIAHVSAYLQWCKENQMTPFSFTPDALAATQPPVWDTPVVH